MTAVEVAALAAAGFALAALLWWRFPQDRPRAGWLLLAVTANAVMICVHSLPVSLIALAVLVYAAWRSIRT